MELGCAGNNNSLAAATKRPQELDGRMMNKGDWTGTKKTKNLQEYQNQKGSGGGGSSTALSSSSSKTRPYERGEHDYDVSMEKLYKCNYWEDPAYAKKIEFFGLALARNAAHDNLCERLYRGQFEDPYPY